MSKIANDLEYKERVIDSEIESFLQIRTALGRLFLFDNQEPFSPNFRSGLRVKQTEKRHFSDPAMAAAMLNMTEQKLMSDLNTFGFLFESLVEHENNLNGMEKNMKEECLICKAPLEYLNEDLLMECAICHKKELSKTRCVNGHYVCNECHTKGIDGIFGVCLSETSKNPVEILNRMMNLPFCHMHGPEHHIMVGAALLTAYKNAGGDLDLSKALTEMKNRGGSVPGGACGFWGACGAGISSGMFVSIISGSTPLAGEPFGLSNRMTSKSLDAIGSVGGPRCCKRDSYLSVLSAVDFVKEHFGVEMEKPEIVCEFSAKNNQCLGKRCPFSKLNH